MQTREMRSRLAMRAMLKAADLALRVGVLQNCFVDKLTGNVGTAINENEADADTLSHARWFGVHLNAFVRRLVRERPKAARALLRFMSTYAQDVYRRTAAQDTGLASPATVVIEPTDRCNLYCPGCYAKSSCDGSDLAYERMVEIVEQVVDMGVSLITLSGGEPFLREKIDRTITRLAKRFRGQGFLVYTNGTLIDEKIARRLGRLGNIFPAISVEGFENDTDARRGNGVFARSHRARQLLAENGVLTGFSATVTRENAESIASDAFLDQRIAEGDMFGWFFLLQPIGRSPRPDLMVTAGQRAMLGVALHRWRLENRPIFMADFWNDGPLVGGCIAGGRNYFHIYANGDISPCVFSPVACGNIFDIIAGRSPYASLKDFVRRNPVFAAFREEQTRAADRARSCLLIDRPEIFRQICRIEDCRPAKNMPEGYLDGAIARSLDGRAAEYREVTIQSPVGV